jgi:Ohr subfamily peroxiredoxin
MNCPPTLSAVSFDAFSEYDVEPLYTTSVRVSSNDAREGHAAGTARSDDGNLQLELRMPDMLDRLGVGANPEQLFAASFAACIHRTLNLLAADVNVDMEHVVTHVCVKSGRNDVDGLPVFMANVEVEMPGVSGEIAEELLKAAERTSPFAKMTRQGIHSRVIQSVFDASKQRVVDVVHTRNSPRMHIR